MDFSSYSFHSFDHNSKVILNDFQDHIIACREALKDEENRSISLLLAFDFSVFYPVLRPASNQAYDKICRLFFSLYPKYRGALNYQLVLTGSAHIEFLEHMSQRARHLKKVIKDLRLMEEQNGNGPHTVTAHEADAQILNILKRTPSANSSSIELYHGFLQSGVILGTGDLYSDILTEHPLSAEPIRHTQTLIGKYKHYQGSDHHTSLRKFSDSRMVVEVYQLHQQISQKPFVYFGEQNMMNIFAKDKNQFARSPLSAVLRMIAMSQVDDQRDIHNDTVSYLKRMKKNLSEYFQIIYESGGLNYLANDDLEEINRLKRKYIDILYSREFANYNPELRGDLLKDIMDKTENDITETFERARIIQEISNVELDHRLAVEVNPQAGNRIEEIYKSLNLRLPSRAP